MNPCTNNFGDIRIGKALTEHVNVEQSVRAKEVQMRESVEGKREELSSLSRTENASLEEIKSAISRSANENQLSQLRARLLEARKNTETALREMRQPAVTDAPSGLPETAKGGVAVPEVSSDAAQQARIA